MAPPIVMDLPSLVDLAIGAPDLGAVNFNILHTILHVIITHLDLTELVVKFKPEDSGKIKALLATAPKGKVIKLAESIQTIGIGGSEKRISLHRQEDGASEESLRKSVEKVTKTVKKIKKKIKDLPSNDELLSRTTSATETVNLDKRMDVAEANIEKLSSMIENVARGSKFTMPINKTIDDAGTAAAFGVDIDVCARIEDLERRVSDVEKNKKSPTPKSSLKGQAQASDAGGETSTALNDLQTKFEEHETKIKKILCITDSLPIDNICQTVKEFEQMKIRVGELSALVMAHEELNLDPKRLEEIFNKANEASTKVVDTDKRLTSAIEILQKQLDEMEREQGEIVEKVTTLTGKEDVESDDDMSGLAELYTKIQLMQSDMDSLATTANRLLDDREQQDLHMNAITEELEVLKMIKADKEDLEDALADKADQLVVNRKVSHDQFDAACDDLSRTLEETISKISQQEIIWQQALDDIQQEMDSKLDKAAVHPLKEFVNNKLSSLQERLKQLAALRRDQEAAAVKKRLIRNVTCLSCDKDVAIKRDSDIPSMPGLKPLPPAKSIKPYLTYELDIIRKEEKRLGYSRNMNQFAQAMKDARRAYKISQRDIGLQGLHLCNRYCGGSHTITTPHQRVTRIGHFLQQWGPEAFPYPKEDTKSKKSSTIEETKEKAPTVSLEESFEEQEIETLLSSSLVGEMTPTTTPRGSLMRGSRSSTQRTSRRTSKTSQLSKKTVPVTPPRSLDEGGEPQTAIEDMEVSEYSTEGGPSTMEGVIEEMAVEEAGDIAAPAEGQEEVQEGEEEEEEEQQPAEETEVQEAPPEKQEDNQEVNAEVQAEEAPDE